MSVETLPGWKIATPGITFMVWSCGAIRADQVLRVDADDREKPFIETLDLRKFFFPAEDLKGVLAQASGLSGFDGTM